MQEVETTLYHLPTPSRQHLDYLENLLQRVRSEIGLSDRDLVERQAAADFVDGFIADVIPGEISAKLESSNPFCKD